MIRCALFSYFGLREPDGTRGQFYYEVVAARLGFLIIFEHIVFLCKFLFQYLIPDVPQGVCMRVSACLSVSLSVSLLVSLCVCLSISLSLCLSVGLSVGLSVWSCFPLPPSLPSPPPPLSHTHTLCNNTAQHILKLNCTCLWPVSKQLSHLL